MEIQGSGKLSYLSKTICEEIIQLTANKVKDTFMAEVKNSGYFSFSVDSAPDISHTDQLTLIIKCVSPEDASFAVSISNSTPFDNQRRDFKPVTERFFITTNKESFVKNITWTT
ncbi:hypothetical protein CEXT_100061 [Caerostris extrusa]|uniref:DUF4371 domain-containing protein n=1 Tax=Caerostris extrusa TaxID=172846 RepID=A0AAV4YCQ1_CAEEX|nr:hypothetical protein CEXT_100061 [Caerostris extrusa]